MFYDRLKSKINNIYNLGIVHIKVNIFGIKKSKIKLLAINVKAKPNYSK